METLICRDVVTNDEINEEIEDLIKLQIINRKEFDDLDQNYAIPATPRGDLKYYTYVQIDSTNEDKIDSLFTFIKQFQSHLNMKNEPNMVYVNCEEKYLNRIREYNIGNMYSALNTDSNFKWTHRALLGSKKCKLINLKSVNFDQEWLKTVVDKLESYKSEFFELETYEPVDFF